MNGPQHILAQGSKHVFVTTYSSTPPEVVKLQRHFLANFIAVSEIESERQCAVCTERVLERLHEIRSENNGNLFFSFHFFHFACAERGGQ